MVASMKLRRFWEKVSVEPSENGYQILLDKHPVRLPQKTVLQVSSFNLAQYLAKEWEKAGGKKGGEFSYEALPLTRIAGTMLERIGSRPEIIIDQLLPYVNGELLCYRADFPTHLVEKQKEEWSPWVSWCNDFLGVKLKIQDGVIPINQSPETIKAFRNYLEKCCSGELAAFAVAVPALGSIVLSIALKENKLDAEKAFEIATLDERVQAETWGQDAEHQRHLNLLKQDVIDAALFLSLL